MYFLISDKKSKLSKVMKFSLSLQAVPCWNTALPAHHSVFFNALLFQVLSHQFPFPIQFLPWNLTPLVIFLSTFSCRFLSQKINMSCTFKGFYSSKHTPALFCTPLWLLNTIFQVILFKRTWTERRETPNTSSQSPAQPSLLLTCCSWDG